MRCHLTNRVLWSLFCLWATTTFASAGHAQQAAPASPTSPKPANTQALRIERLSSLCKLWGAVKYFHPSLAYREIDWDAALVQTIPKVQTANSKQEYIAALRGLLATLHDPNTHISEETAATPAPKGKADTKPQPYLRWEGEVAVLVATQPSQFEGDFAKGAVLEKLLTEAAKAQALIFDLRSEEEPGETFWIETAFQRALPVLLTHRLSLASSRHRFHSGYPPQNGMTSGGYFSGFVTIEGPGLAPRKAQGTPQPTAFLINAKTPGLHALLSGLQHAHRTTVIQEGTTEKEAGIETYPVRLSEGVSVQMRISEFVNPDGSVGFQPDRVVAPAPNKASDPAMEAALQAVREPQSTPRTTHGTTGAYVASRPENPYMEMPFPSQEYRLLALFRFWNVIHYFYPYKPLLDRPWEEVLPEFIPRMEAAQNALEYHTTVANLVTRIQDTHGFLRSPVLSEHLGSLQPFLQVRFIQGQTVVTYIGEEAAKQAPRLAVGDIILSVDGEEIGKRRERLGRLFAASTPQALQWRVHQQILAGPANRKATLTVRDKAGRVQEVALTRSQPRVLVQRTTPVFGILPSGFGYMDLERLTVPEVDKALEAIKKTPALIFDMRGYPNGTAWSLGPRLTSKKVVAARFQRPELHSPDPEWTSAVQAVQTIEPSPAWHYKGKVVVLINEEAISQAEHTCLYIEAATNTTFIGSPTNGANGDVTNVPLPGGITVGFSGHDVRHGDGRQLQRRGIQPHIRVLPTIKGLRKGQDEVLEAAVKFLKGQTRSVH